MNRLHAKRGIFAGMIAVALSLGGLAPAASSPLIPLPPAPIPHVQGNHMVDLRTNQIFTVHGANWPGFEYACWQGWGYSRSFSAGEAAAIASWGINAVRIPLNQDCWLGLSGSPAYGTTAGYRAAVNNWVQLLNTAGVVAILDLHSSAPVGYAAHGQRAMADSQSLAFWASVAGTFASNPSVIFDAFNEPYSRWNNDTHTWAFQLTWECWKNGGCAAPVEDDYTSTLSGSTFPVAGMSAIVSAIRGAGATQPIMLGGLDYSNDIRGWLANAPADGQLVASWHNYPGQRCSTLTCWNNEIAPVASVVPVVAGEFGQTDGGSSFLTTFLDWADLHGIGYAAWAWWKVTDAESLTNSRYALVDDPGFTPKAPSGTTYHAHLAALPTTAAVVTRISGEDHYATSLAVSAKFPAGVDTVYVASGTSFVESLSAAPAAVAAGGPLLLTPNNSVSPALQAELIRLSPNTIVIVGGTDSISQGVETQLALLAPHVRRDSGVDRYATSREVVRKAFVHGATTAFVATGDQFADALRAATAAAANHAPVIVIDGNADHVDSATVQLLVDLGVHQVTIVGGPWVVSPGVEASLAAALGASHVARTSVQDPYQSSRGVNQISFTPSSTVYLASGDDFQEALTGSALAGATSAPLYLIRGTCVPQPVLSAIQSLRPANVTLLGGTDVVSVAVETLTPC